MKRYTKERKFSLRLGLELLVICCWVIPVVLAIFLLSYYTSAQLKEQIVDTITVGVDSAIDITEQNMKSIIADSRDVSYDSVIKENYQQFLETNNHLVLYDSTVDYLAKEFKYNDFFTTTILYYTENPERIYYTNNISNTNHDENINAYKAQLHDDVKALSKELNTEIAFLKKGETVYMVRNIVNSSFEPFAVVIMELDIYEIFLTLHAVAWIKDANMTIDETKLIIIGEEVETLNETVGRELSIIETQDGIYNLQVSQTIDRHKVNYLLKIDSSMLANSFADFKFLMTLILLFVIPLLSVVVYLLNLHISRPLKSLLKAAEEIENGERGYQIIEHPKSKEFSYLTESFNNMSVSMKEQFERSYLEQIALQDARINALQSQINPHFLNNTLEIINWEARMSKDIKVSKMIEALSTMLTAATARGGKPLIQLREEMLYVDAYLYINSVRMGKRLAIVKNIKDELLSREIPLLIMQPVVENAIEHGVSTRQRGMVTIRAYETQEYLVLEVENDNPLTEEDRDTIHRLLNWEGETEDLNVKHNRLGIRNVNQRLKIMFGENYGLCIVSMDNNCTISRLTLPKNISKNKANNERQ